MSLILGSRAVNSAAKIGIGIAIGIGIEHIRIALMIDSDTE